MSFLKKIRQKRAAIYADFRTDFNTNPMTNDLALRTDEDAIKEALKNLMLTDKGERLFQPNLGSDIKATLFENNTPATLKILKEKILALINNFEPRVGVIDVNIYSQYSDENVKVDFAFYMQNREQPVQVTIFLERTR